MAVPDTSWTADGLCVDAEDPDLWFAEWEEPERRREAIRLCGGCLVRTQCLEYAQRTRPQYGVWGGRAFHHPPRGVSRAA